MDSSPPIFWRIYRVHCAPWFEMGLLGKFVFSKGFPCTREEISFMFNYGGMLF